MKLTPAFVKTRNVRNFEVLMNGLDLAAGEGRFGLVIRKYTDLCILGVSPS